MQIETVSKSQLKVHLLEYLRSVEKEQKPIIVTHFGKPVAKVVPYTQDPKSSLRQLRDTVVLYDRPTDPVGEEDWEAL